jgi:hypothetical protein
MGARMSDLQDIIVNSSIKAFKNGYHFGKKEELSRVIGLLEQHENETHCDCDGCKSWTNAFEFLIREIKGEVNG